jgi:lipopolysaccharide biosynthesis protein
MPGPELARAAPYCSRLVVRRNQTLDFGSWKVGLERAGDLARVSRLMLANDSCYGPVSDLGRFLERMPAAEADVWGMTDSLELEPHLQSYFLLFYPRALASPMFHEFWREFRFVRSKYRVIQDYELGLSRKLRQAGLRLRAAYPYEKVAAAARAGGEAFQYREELVQGPLNPTLFMWDVLVREFSAPFIKTELFRQDRFKSRAIADLRPLLAKAGKYDPGLIERDPANGAAPSGTRR